MGLPTAYRVGENLVFMTSDRLAALVKEALPNWGTLDVLLGRTLDGERSDEAIRRLEAALATKERASPARFHWDWVRFELSDPAKIGRNIWALLRDYCRYYECGVVEADSPEPVYPGKYLDIYPVYEVLSVHYPRFAGRLRVAAASLLRPARTAIHIRVSRIRKVVGTLQAFALVGGEFTLLFRPKHIWTILEPTVTEPGIESFWTTFGPL